MNDISPEIPEIDFSAAPKRDRNSTAIFITATLGMTLAALAALHMRQQRLLTTAMGELDKITDSVLEYATILRQLDTTSPADDEGPADDAEGPGDVPVLKVAARPAGRPAKAGGESGENTSAQS